MIVSDWDDRAQVLAFHGFLGEGSDFQSLLRDSSVRERVGRVWAPTWWKWVENAPHWKDVVDSFWREHGKALERRPVNGVGYSMGGRFLLRLALAHPEGFKSLSFISTSPGLTLAAERAARIQQDAHWSQLLLDEKVEWGDVIGRWNSQSIFQRGTAPPQRICPAASRATLAHAVGALSPGVEEPVWDRLVQLSQPVQWWAGEWDPKYLEIARKAAAHCKRGAAIRVAQGEGHRLGPGFGEALLLSEPYVDHR